MYWKVKKKGKRGALKRMLQKACAIVLTANMLGQPAISCLANQIEGSENNSIAAQSNDATGEVNQRLAVQLTPMQSTVTNAEVYTEANNDTTALLIGEAYAGESQYVKVVSSYSHANNPEQPATVRIKIGALPEQVTIAGFTDGEKTVVWKDSNNVEQTVTARLTEETTAENVTEHYVTFEQPAGATVEFSIQFNSENGLMEPLESVEVSVDDIQNVDGAGNDIIGEPVTLNWTAENHWDAVQKWVNNAKNNQILVTESNQLSGELTYTIQANSLNNDSYGEIWTDYVTVTDTLTLPEGILLPTGAYIKDDAVVTADGKTKIFYFTDKQEIEVTKLELTGDRRGVTYEIKVPNTHRENGVLTAEQDHLSLEMKLYANALTLADGYKDKTNLAEDKIVNEVTMTPHPYKGEEGATTSDSVYTTMTPTPEEFIVEKSAKESNVQAGDEITYTIKVTNTGKTDIKVKDENGNYYAVTDEMPDYLTLTEKQIANLPSGVTYDKNTNTVSWIPGTENLKQGAAYQISFAATVKDADDEAMQSLKNGNGIYNRAQYKSVYSNWAYVKYEKSELKIEKEGETAEGDGKLSNGEAITYTVTVENDTDFDAKVDGAVEDALPDGLEFVAALDKDLNQYTASGTYAVASNKLTNGRTVVFSKDGQNLSWNIGMLKAHEKIEITYICKLNADELASGTEIRNTAKTDDHSNTEKTEIDYPIDLEKTVAQDTSQLYKDGDEFDYTITVSNDAEHPSQKKDCVIQDALPVGMLPTDDYELIMHKSDGSTQKCSWKKLSETDNYSWNNEIYFTTTIDGREATVTRDWDGSVNLIWSIGKLAPGQTIEIHYRTKITIEDGQTGKIPFTNQVKVGVLNKSVTVYGGEAVGEICLEKQFDGATLWNTYNLTEEQKNITFTLAGVDENNNAITFSDGSTEQSVTLGNFNYAYYKDNWHWHHVFSNLPAGTYTITEKNAQVDGKILTTTYKVNGRTSANCYADSTEQSGTKVSLEDGKSAEVIVNNSYGSGSSVDLQKSVWAIRQLKTDAYGNETWSNWYDKELFPTKDKTLTNYVVYNMTVINTGSETIHLDTLEDELPEGISYVGIRGDFWNVRTGDFGSKASTHAYSDITNYGGNNLAHGVEVTSETQDKKVIFSYNKENGGYNLEGGKAITFLVLCKIADDVAEDVPITNTARLTVDEEVEYRDYDEVKMTKTPYDLIQNNGTSKDEGVSDGKRTISSSVTITPVNNPVPGIEKEAVSYIVPGKTEEKSLDGVANIQPQAMVHWKITLHNSGTMDLKNYCVDDTVTAYHHLITKAEAGEKGLEAPYQLEIYDYADNLQKTIDVSEQVWNVIGDSTDKNSFTFDFTSDAYTIPPGGYAVLTLYTNNLVENYKIYKNTATILPNEAFDANQTKYGELIKNENGAYSGLKASAEVNALGEYASVSWKTVTEKGNEENTASGTNGKNYISVGLDENGTANLVTYTDNIQNISGKTFRQFVVIDLMPMKKDTGVINQEDLRGSEFKVSYAGNLKVYVKESDGTKNTVSKSDYTIEFSTKTSYTQKDFDGNSSDWHESWQDGDCSFRVKMSDSFELEPGQTLILQYDGEIEDGASPGERAWNSFGYQYQSTENSFSLMAEPPKVGVMIPKAPVVKKLVYDSYGNELGYDKNKEFTFELYQTGESSTQDVKLCEFTICQGGYTKLSNLTDSAGNRVNLVNGKEYKIKEVAQEGYELLGIGEEGAKLSTYQDEYTFTYYAEKDISILIRNESFLRPEIPDTGGMGTNVYTVGGVLLMLAASLLYGYRGRRKKYGKR